MEANESKEVVVLNESNDKQQEEEEAAVATGESHNMIDVYDQSYFNNIAN